MPCRLRSRRLPAILLFSLLVATPAAKAQCSANTIGWGDVDALPNNPFHAELCQIHRNLNQKMQVVAMCRAYGADCINT
jgi:hypothetical protein